MIPQFPTNYSEIQERLFQVDPAKYETTRNFLQGDVTYLSPYITHGVFSLPEIVSTLEQRFDLERHPKLLQELAWREYFQRVWEAKNEAIFSNLKHERGFPTNQLSQTIIEASTGIHAIDDAISSLYKTGYMHNHARMWTASLVTNFAKTDWLSGAKWMYYHLLDGDLASNMLSWQWVAGTFSSKPYLMNQDNINKYSRTNQSHTFLDASYEELAKITGPIEPFIERTDTVFEPFTITSDPLPNIDNKDVYLHDFWNLSPTWHANEGVHLIILDPQWFEQFPISPKRQTFFTKLAHAVLPNAPIIVSSITELHLDTAKSITSIQHPMTKNIPGIKEEPMRLFPTITGYYPSFFKFWKTAISKKARRHSE